MSDGPQAYSHAERMQRAWEIAGRMQRHYAQAMGVYGWLARAADGPYSAIQTDLDQLLASSL
jgi:hypothetical protein